MTSARVVDLDDGRRLAYEEWGDASGRPVVFLHGSPGSRRCCPDPDAVERARIRLITFDRPGYGESDRDPGRAPADTARDVAALVDRLGIGRFAVAGVSGGGLHTLACAVDLADRLDGVAVVSMPGPLDEVPGAWERLGDRMRPTAAVARIDPKRARRAVERFMQPSVENPSGYVGGGGSPVDRAMKADPRYRGTLVEEMTIALAGGAGGMADDLCALWRPWGFALDDVPPGVRVFHGAEDHRAEDDFEHLRHHLRGAVATVWPDEGHLGIVRRFVEVLASVA
ncbi:MAG TPA: alpha/beta hydrolase [Acidimicrobiia bacterium]|nr:alpha/beta hydrolase [Acidimicrobiia bacterium]